MAKVLIAPGYSSEPIRKLLSLLLNLHDSAGGNDLLTRYLISNL